MTAPAAPLEKAVEEARVASVRWGGSGYIGALRCAKALIALLAALDADRGEAEKQLAEAESLLLDVWDSQHREGWELTETEPSVIDRLGDWRWNNGYDPCNPPLRDDPRKVARREVPE